MAQPLIAQCWDHVAALMLRHFCAGLFWLQKGQANVTSEARNVTGLVFFEMMFLSFRAMLGALFTFPTEFKMLLKVHSSHTSEK